MLQCIYVKECYTRVCCPKSNGTEFLHDRTLDLFHNNIISKKQYLTKTHTLLRIVSDKSLVIILIAIVPRNCLYLNIFVCGQITLERNGLFSFSRIVLAIVEENNQIVDYGG